MKRPSPTGFLRRHPFKPGWEIRRCLECKKDTAYSEIAANQEINKT